MPISIRADLLFNGEEIQSEHGLLDLLNEEVKEDRLYEPLHYRGKTYRICVFSHLQLWRDLFFLCQWAVHSGWRNPPSAFREGILKGVNEFAKKNFQGVDVREGIVGTILIKIKDPVFESQTKNKLSNNEIRGSHVQEVKDAVQNLLYKHQKRVKRSLRGSSSMKN